MTSFAGPLTSHSVHQVKDPKDELGWEEKIMPWMQMRCRPNNESSAGTEFLESEKTLPKSRKNHNSFGWGHTNDSNFLGHN